MMQIEIRQRGGPASRLYDIAVSHDPGNPVRWQFLNGLYERDLRDLEVALAQFRERVENG